MAKKTTKSKYRVKPEHKAALQASGGGSDVVFEPDGDVMGRADNTPDGEVMERVDDQPEVEVQMKGEPAEPAQGQNMVETQAPITVRFEAVDGANGSTEFPDLKSARREAHKRVGAHPEIGVGYAVSGDGVVKVMVEGATLQDLFPEGDTLDEPKPTSVVKDVFKDRYAANAREQGVKGKAAKRSNWDWLSQAIARYCLTEKHAIRIDDFIALLEANGVDHSNWTNRNRGWEGRFRMTGRVALQRIVATQGELKYPDGSVDKAPMDFILKYKAK